MENNQNKTDKTPGQQTKTHEAAKPAKPESKPTVAPTEKK